jgi:hypothetical protein
MHTPISSGASGAELPAMMATLCAVENRFGPYHPHTLQLMTTVALEWGHQGGIAEACRLLERVLRDLNKLASPQHSLRLRAVTALRDYWLQQQNLVKAAATQKEVLACMTEALGAGHPDAVAARRHLAALLLDASA